MDDRHESLVSVIIPCFNQGRFLPFALDSVSRQSHARWECIIVDDGSTDETARIAAEHASADPRIRVVSQSNRGLSAARNAGLALAKGRFLQFLDADDWIAPDKLPRQVAALRECTRPAAAYCFFHYAYDDEVTTLHSSARSRPRLATDDPAHEIALRWESDLIVPSHCFLFDSRLFHSHAIRFDESLPNHEDWDCWLRVFAPRPPLALIEAELACYRLRTQSMSSRTALMWKGAKRVCDKHIALASTARNVRAALCEKRRQMYDAYRALRSEEILSRAFGRGFEGYRSNVPWAAQRIVSRAVGSLGLLVSNR
ncbi:MAG TPA: glycosyltransferase family 2 protein [Casimicrobiaceae bacterium]|nr:glycosyltransferase family 2 protein [Casimicrobiaceae bacterium]